MAGSGAPCPPGPACARQGAPGPAGLVAGGRWMSWLRWVTGAPRSLSCRSNGWSLPGCVLAAVRQQPRGAQCLLAGSTEKRFSSGWGHKAPPTERWAKAGIFSLFYVVCYYVSEFEIKKPLLPCPLSDPKQSQCQYWSTYHTMLQRSDSTSVLSSRCGVLTRALWV